MAFSKESAFDRLRAAQAAGRLAHAHLITGPVGSGKTWLAVRLAAVVLDCAPEDVPTHADAHILQPESKSRRIVIDQIRSLEQAVQRKPLLGAFKVVIIHDAERMQPQAANAFLKTLEEPPENSLIFLLSSLPEAILETVLSRCVETALQDTIARESSVEEQTILKALEECLVQPATPSITEAFRFTRAIQGLLSAQRERISSEYEDSLKADTAHYKQTSDSASWLDDRGEQIKALAEAAALRERERILHLVTDALGEALRSQHGHPPRHATAKALAEKFPTANLLRRIDSLEMLRRRLAQGVQEGLALESGFLEMIVN